jgi:hypothetical protein
MPIARRLVSGFALFAAILAAAMPAGAAHVDDIALQIATIGDLRSEASVRHGLDGAHFCSTAPDPWTDPIALDGRATPFPFYRVVFGQASPEDEPDRPGPSLGLALSNYFAAARAHSDQANDSIELVIGGRHFVGHSGLDDPGYHLTVTFNEDRQGGGFAARHLHETGSGNGVIDVAGNWQCAPVAADPAEVTVRAHTLFAGAQPLRAEATHLRLWRADLPCIGSACGDWRVIDQTTGDAFMAKVDLRRLRLARALRRMAETGAVELLVDADIRPGDPPSVVPHALAGVQPVFAPDADPPPAGKLTNAALR